MHPNQDNVVSFHPDRSLDNLPPQNIEAEEAILGGIMLDPEAITRVSNRLSFEICDQLIMLYRDAVYTKDPSDRTIEGSNAI